MDSLLHRRRHAGVEVGSAVLQHGVIDALFRKDDALFPSQADQRLLGGHGAFITIGAGVFEVDDEILSRDEVAVGEDEVVALRRADRRVQDSAFPKARIRVSEMRDPQR
ncbi:MAG: hypothetical protein ACYC7E_07920 [Armatimonadota bacterium]